jgi:hypothetical protein
MLRRLTFDEIAAALDGLAGCAVTVRVVSASDDLVAVFYGELGRRSDEKHPALFWPLGTTGQTPAAERPGIYLHPGRFQDAAAHPGDWVLELRQDGVTLNIRRL